MAGHSKSDSNATNVTTSIIKDRHAALAAWILGPVLMVYLMAIACLIPEPTASQNRIFEFFMALLAGLFSYFFVGAVSLAISQRKKKVGHLWQQRISAGGGFALFLIVFLSPNPVGTIRTFAGDHIPTAVRPDERLKAFQRYLIDNQLLQGTPDGIRREATSLAIRHFQTEHELDSDGVLTAATFEAIRNIKFRGDSSEGSNGHTSSNLDDGLGSSTNVTGGTIETADAKTSLPHASAAQNSPNVKQIGAGLKSSASKVPVPIVFANLSQGEIYVGWIDQDGKIDRDPEISFFLEPGKSRPMKSYFGHVWVISDPSSGTNLRIVTVTTDTKEVDYP